MGETALNFEEVMHVVDAEFSSEPAAVLQIRATLDLDVVRPRFEDYKNEAARIASEAKALTVQDQESLNVAVTLGGTLKRIAAKVETQRKAIIADPQEFIDGVNKLCGMITDSLVTKKNSKKEITNPDCAENLLKTKINQHQAKVELERREAERKAREAAEALQKKLQQEADEANRKAAEEARKRTEEEQRIKREREEADARERGANKAELEALAQKAEEERLAAIRKAEEDAAKIAVVAPTVVPPVVQEAPRVTRTENGSAFSKNPWVFEVIDSAAVPREFMSVDEKKIRDAVKMGLRAIAGVRIYKDSQINFRS